MEIGNFRIVIVSLPERENCVCEVIYRQVNWIEISHESDEFIVQMYDHYFGEDWKFILDESIKILDIASEKYLKFMGPLNNIELEKLENPKNNDFKSLIKKTVNFEIGICEIYYRNLLLAEITTEVNEVVIRFFSHPSEDHWEFNDLNGFIKELKLARSEYLSFVKSNS